MGGKWKESKTAVTSKIANKHHYLKKKRKRNSVVVTDDLYFGWFCQFCGTFGYLRLVAVTEEISDRDLDSKAIALSRIG